MSDPQCPQKAPYPVEARTGDKLFWCSCGKSANQPFCDGSHQGSDFTPVKIDVDAEKTLYLCGCKRSGNGAFCDGTHNSL